MHTIAHAPAPDSDLLASDLLPGEQLPGDLFPRDLFPSAMLQLVEDDQGGIRYWPGFIEAPLAQAWFAALHAHAAWTHLRRPMYDRLVDVPRLLASYRPGAFPPQLPLLEMLDRVGRQVPAPYNSVGLNLYRDGNDSVAMHNDKLPGLGPGQPIALVSLGDTRRMLIRPRHGARQALAVDLEPGSLLCMSHACQSTHEHGIPKTRRAQGPRISVVFRVRAP